MDHSGSANTPGLFFLGACFFPALIFVGGPRQSLRRWPTLPQLWHVFFVGCDHFLFGDGATLCGVVAGALVGSFSLPID